MQCSTTTATPPPVRGRGEIGRRRRLKIAFLWSAGSSPAVRTILLSLALGACHANAKPGTVIVSAIGSPPRTADPGATTGPTRLLTASVAQGLVRFDAAGAIEPGLAERWIVMDDGLSYIFRLREASWPDGSPVTTPQVAAQLRRLAAPSARNRLQPFLSAIDEIVAMTPQVIEVRLSRPRPDLLKLFAQPELAIARAGGGSGPLRRVDGAPVQLAAVPDPTRVDADGRALADRSLRVRLIGERAAVAIARFARGNADLVAGGTFVDWPLVALAGLRDAAIRIDPAAGLFGLAVVSREGFLADAANRAAVAQVIDRTATLRAVAANWPEDERLLPDQLDSAAPPVQPAWAGVAAPDRLAAARARVAIFGRPVRLRVALPTGPGATRLWGQLARSLLHAGITPERVALDAPAELRLVDAVAPYDSARWYLATACQPCGAAAQATLEAAREAPTAAERAARLAEADAAVTADAAFIPLARPWRWSLVAPRLRGWQPNARAWHPLNHLLADPT